MNTNEINTNEEKIQIEYTEDFENDEQSLEDKSISLATEDILNTSDDEDSNSETSSISDFDENEEIIEDHKIIQEYRNIDEELYGKIYNKNNNNKMFKSIAETYNQKGIQNNKKEVERKYQIDDYEVKYFGDNEDVSSDDDNDNDNYNDNDNKSKSSNSTSSISESEYSEDNKDKIMIKSNNYINLPSEFERIQNRMSIYQNTLLEKMEIMFNKINTIEDRLTRLEQNAKFNYVEFEGEILTIKELKMERLDIDEDIVLKALVYKNYQSVIYIMRHYYRTTRGNKVFYPIRMKSRRNFEYFYNNQWLNDAYGHYITKVICNNVQNLFLRYNKINKHINEEELFFNQQFILKLSEEKYKKEIFKNIVDELMTTSYMFTSSCYNNF